MCFGVTGKPTRDPVSLHHLFTPSLGVNPVEFLDELFIAKTKILRLFVSEDLVILACVVFTQCQRVTDGQLHRICIASYADAL